jgi:hypothetical protein
MCPWMNQDFFLTNSHDNDGMQHKIVVSKRSCNLRTEILGLSETVTNLNNRWHSVEKAKGKRTSHTSMRSHCSGIRLMLEPLLKFSKAM